MTVAGDTHHWSRGCRFDVQRREGVWPDGLPVMDRARIVARPAAPRRARWPNPTIRCAGLSGSVVTYGRLPLLAAANADFHTAIRPSSRRFVSDGSGVLVAQGAAAEPGDGEGLGQVGLAQDG